MSWYKEQRRDDHGVIQVGARTITRRAKHLTRLPGLVFDRHRAEQEMNIREAQSVEVDSHGVVQGNPITGVTGVPGDGDNLEAQVIFLDGSSDWVKHTALQSPALRRAARKDGLVASVRPGRQGTRRQPDGHEADTDEPDDTRMPRRITLRRGQKPSKWTEPTGQYALRRRNTLNRGQPGGPGGDEYLPGYGRRVR